MHVYIILYNAMVLMRSFIALFVNILAVANTDDTHRYSIIDNVAYDSVSSDPVFPETGEVFS